MLRECAESIFRIFYPLEPPFQKKFFFGRDLTPFNVNSLFEPMNLEIFEKGNIYFVNFVLVLAFGHELALIGVD